MLTLCGVLVVFIFLACLLIACSAIIGFLPAVIIVIALAALDWAVIKKIFRKKKK